MSDAIDPQIPRGWAKTSLGEIVAPRIGRADPKSHPTARFIGMEHVEAHSMRLLGTVPAATMKSGANTFQPHDVLYGRMRSYLNKVCQPDFDGLCSGEFIVLPESMAVHGRFLKYRLNAADFVRFASRINTGDRPRVDFDQIRMFGIGLPPRPEQERIADALDELLSDLDAGVAALERIQAKLKHYRAVVLKAAVEGVLTAEWRTDSPTGESGSNLLTRILAERRRRWEDAQLQKFKEAGKEPPKNWEARYEAPSVPDVTRLRALPVGWCWATIDQLTELVTSGSRGWKEFYSTAGAMFIRSQDIRSDSLDLTAVARVELPKQSEGTRTKVNQGDLLITITGANVAKAAIVEADLTEAYVSQHVGLLRLVDPSLAPYAHLYTVAPSGGRKALLLLAYGAGKPGLNLDNLRELPVPMPPSDERDCIVDAAEDQTSVIHHLEADLESKVRSAQALRQSILRQAFAGLLVPQDPNDEPATALLNRLATERERPTLRKAREKATRPKRRARHSSAETVVREEKIRD